MTEGMAANLSLHDRLIYDSNSTVDCLIGHNKFVLVQSNQPIDRSIPSIILYLEFFMARKFSS